MSLGEMKKNALLEFFQEAVRGAVRNDTARTQKAVDKALSVGLTMDDIEWVAKMEGPEFRKVFGENALPIDLLERMEDFDNLISAGPWPVSKHFESFYKAPKA
jgi:hypothetical protein